MKKDQGKTTGSLRANQIVTSTQMLHDARQLVTFDNILYFYTSQQVDRHVVAGGWR